MKKTVILVGAIIALALTFSSVRTKAQTIGVSLVRIYATRSTGLPIAIPTPYLNSTHITTAVTVVPKNSVGVLGCVVIGVAGAAGSTIKIYNGPNILAANLMTTVDGTQVGHQFCYGMIFNHGLGFAVVVASGGAIPDVVVTWR